jgi:Spy/CpxP family protein refolding chaperone
MALRARNRLIGRLLLALFIGVFAASTASAQTPPKPPAATRQAGMLRGPFRPIVMQLRGLNLTPEQRQQVLGVFKAHQPEIKALGQDMRAARVRWEQAGQISIQERKELLGRRQTIMSAVRSEVFGVLTAEQRTKVEARLQRVPRKK